MKIQLNALEVRIIGCLIEKEITTPEQYPLSVNALTNACNQKTNREPVLELDDATVRNTVDGLTRRGLASDKSGYGGRVPKYKHRFCNTDFRPLNLTAQELGILCVMFLRGPQTPGELRTRTNRLCEFADVSEVEAVLNPLVFREAGPFIARLPRLPGAREPRYAHLFSGPIESAPETLDEPAPVVADALAERVARLEAVVEELRRELAVLNTTRAQSA